MSRRFDESSPDYSERVSLWLYGLMVAGATLVAGAQVGDLWDLVVLVIVTNVIYYMTHLFASWVAPRSDGPGDSLRHHAWVAAPMVSAAFSPLAVTLIASAFGADRATAVWFGLGTVMAGFAVVAAVGMRRRGFSRPQILVAAAFVVALAGLLIAAKLSVH